MKPIRDLLNLALLLVLLAAGCRPAQKVSTAPRAEALRAAGKLVVGTALTAPFEYHDPKTGALVGFDVEVAEAIAAWIGVPIEWKEMAFAELLPALQAGQVDLVIAAMYITPERQAAVLMSEGYVETGLVIVTRTDAAPLTGPEGLNGQTIGVKEGATGARYVRRLKEQGFEFTVQEYANTRDSLEDLAQGYVDVILNDKINSIQYIKSNPGLMLNGPILEPASLGIAVGPNDPELLAIVNEVLAQLRADQSLDMLYEKWILTP